MTRRPARRAIRPILSQRSCRWHSNEFAFHGQPAAHSPLVPSTTACAIVGTVGGVPVSQTWDGMRWIVRPTPVRRGDHHEPCPRKSARVRQRGAATRRRGDNLYGRQWVLKVWRRMSSSDCRSRFSRRAPRCSSRAGRPRSTETADVDGSDASDGAPRAGGVHLCLRSVSAPLRATSPR